MKLERGLPLCVVLVLTLHAPSRAYGPIGHMRIVVENWNDVFAPNLNHKSILDKDLAFAALAGAVSSDIGYVIAGARPFTDSVHYVRSGDFAAALVQKAGSGSRARDPRLLAFALGFQTHYWADRFGHYSATNMLVAKIKHEPIARVTYERDPCTHTWVETQLSVLDLHDAPAIMKTGFIEAIGKMHGEQDAFLTAAYLLIEDTVEEVFPGMQLAFRAYDLYRFLRFVATSLSLTDEMANKMFWIGVPWKPNEWFDELRTGSEKRPDEGSALATLRENLVRTLPLDRELVHMTYNDSLQNVARHMRASSGSLTNFNLDTNLPSESGQYKCADAAFHQLAERVNSSGAAASGGQQIHEFQQVLSNYEKAGAGTRQQFIPSVSDHELDLLVRDSDLKTTVDKSLFDISPLPLPSANEKALSVVGLKRCPSRAGFRYMIGDQSFVLDTSDGVLCVSEKARTLEFVYGYRLASDTLKVVGTQSSADVERQKAIILDRIMPEYREALDRTRLDEDVSKYPAGSCPDCGGKAVYKP
jgi:hypothetical protein